MQMAKEKVNVDASGIIIRWTEFLAKKKRQSGKYKWQKMMPMIKNDFSRGLFERESFQPII
jgi:hypothetical protein